MVALQRSAFLDAIRQHDPRSPAVIHSLSGRTFPYGSLLQDVAAAKERLLAATDRTESTIVGERVAFLVENGYDYVVTLLACLASNAIAVPLAPSFPAAELRYILNHSEALALLSSAKFAKIAHEVLQEGLDHPPISVSLDKITQPASPTGSVELKGEAGEAAGGMMLYTSGTTARPKGVLLPTAVLAAQAHSLLEAWKYSPQDRLLHVLPLHHIHGTVNAMLTPLLAGSTIEFMFPFNVDNVWKRLAAPFLSDEEDINNSNNGHAEMNATNGHSEKTSTNGLSSASDSTAATVPITFFTVVPTIWARMLATHSALPMPLLKASKQAIQRQHLRLNISGSAALPTPTKLAWSNLSAGNTLLERFGMTEVGMALSCGLDDADRLDGSVGWPLPTVEARLVDPDTHAEILPGEDLTAEGKERSGEIQLRGPTIFKEYWRNPTATAKEFTPDGWFKTGDIAVRKPAPAPAGTGLSGSWAVGPAYFIHGRQSADIIKTGGEKVSALEIEREILGLPEVRECAVVGLTSEAWGQKVAVVVVVSAQGVDFGAQRGKPWGAMDLRRALKGKLVAYKIPQDLVVVEEIPRNAMGKVNKKALVESVFGDAGSIRRRSVLVAEEKRKGREEAGKAE